MSDVAHVTVDSAPDGHVFDVLIPLRDGRKIKVRGRATVGDLGMVGDIGFFNLKKFAKKVARSKAFRSVMKVVNSPIISSLLPPGVGAALAIANKASKAIAGAKRGDPAARAALQRAAETGSPAVLEGLRVAAAASGVRLRFAGQARAGRRAQALQRAAADRPVARAYSEEESEG